MENVIRIKCKEPNCNKYVEYKPQEVPIVMGFREVLGPRIDTIISVREFDYAVKKIATKLKLKGTKRVYLTCEKGHAYPYEVPE